MNNKELIEKYPFLLPRNRWNDEVDEEYDYSYTELDAMPNGWRKVFGEMMCKEIKNELLRFGQKALDEYRIVQIKSKYGQLRWYDNGYPVGSKIGDIIGKYTTLSENICERCGKPDVPMTGDGWYEPFCLDCWTSFGHNDAEDWQRWSSERGCKMSDVYVYTRFTKDKTEKVEIDISDTAEKIRRNWNGS